MNNDVYDYFTQGTSLHPSDDPVEQGRYIIEVSRMQDKGGYALGSGNSIPDYIPEENYLAMIRTVHEFGR